MGNITLSLSDDLFSELSDTATALKCTLPEFIELAVSHFFQTPTLENSLEAMERISDQEALVDFPELRDELELDIKFHPLAIEELESLSQEDQITILENLVSRISEESDDEAVDLVIKETPEYQIVLSEFHFGQVVYKIGESIIVYYVSVSDDYFENNAHDEEE